MANKAKQHRGVPRLFDDPLFCLYKQETDALVPEEMQALRSAATKTK